MIAIFHSYFYFFLLKNVNFNDTIYINSGCLVIRYHYLGGMNMATHQLVKFVIDDESFGVEITKVREILKPQEIFKVPNTPTFIEGLLNLRGNVVTIYNLRKKFNMKEIPFDDETKIIIVSVNELLVGFIVDRVNEIIRIDDEDIQDTPSSIMSLDKKFLSGVAKINEKLVLLLDLEKVLTHQEEAKVKELIETHKDNI